MISTYVMLGVPSSLNGRIQNRGENGFQDPQCSPAIFMDWVSRILCRLLAPTVSVILIKISVNIIPPVSLLLLYCCSPFIYRANVSSRKFKSLSTKEKETIKQLASKRLLFGIKAAIGFVFLIVVLASSVLSKLTLVTLTDQLRIAHTNGSPETLVTLYWYIQFILLIPSFITFIRCLVVGVIGKTTKSFPWPTGKAILYVSELNIVFVAMQACTHDMS